MQPNDYFRDVTELKPGDVLLCHCDPSKDIVAGVINTVTSSEYCHAAIYYGDLMVAESTAKNGIKKGKIEKVSVSDVVSRYEHVAVLRQPDAWSSKDRVAALKLFIENVVKNQAKYNLDGVFRFRNKKKQHESNIHEKLAHFFDGNLSPQAPQKHKYFCSEFICDCFIAVGFILDSASIVYQSDTYSPGDLGKDPTFGTFWGYLTTNKSYKVDEKDFYYYTSPYDEIFSLT